MSSSFGFKVQGSGLVDYGLKCGDQLWVWRDAGIYGPRLKAALEFQGFTEFGKRLAGSSSGRRILGAGLKIQVLGQASGFTIQGNGSDFRV